MSAPAGWYPTPDGRERFWDGQAWSDQIRDAAPAVPDHEDQIASDPTAALETPSTWDEVGSSSIDPTQQLSVEATQQIDTEATQQFSSGPAAAEPASGPGAFSSSLPAWGGPTQQTGGGTGYDPAGATAGVTPAAGPPAYGVPPVPGQPDGAYGQPGGAYGQPGGAYGQQGAPAYGQPGGAYGQPGAPAYGPPQKSSGKGCLIAALVTVGLVVLLGIVGAVLVARFVDKVAKDPTSVLPSDLMSSLSSEMPLPSDLPSGIDPSAPGGVDNPIVTTIGGEIAFPELTIAKGWTVEKGDLPGLAEIKNMTGTTTGSGSVLMFDLTFSDGTTDLGSTFCTADPTSGSTVEIKCLPVEDKVAAATKVTASVPF